MKLKEILRILKRYPRSWFRRVKKEKKFKIYHQRLESMPERFRPEVNRYR